MGRGISVRSSDPDEARHPSIYFAVTHTTETQAVIRGPNLTAAKWFTVVVAAGDRVYALARHPDLRGEPNFAPWLEVLKDRIHGSWRPLPRPPCFPWRLTPTQLLVSQRAPVRSYAVVGSHLLHSYNGTAGTQAFDMEAQAFSKLRI